MDGLWKTMLWRQFGAAINMLDDAVAACPEALWTQRLWHTPPPSEFPPQFAEFWYVTYHTLVWLDFYLSGLSEEQFAPPAPFVQGVVDSAQAVPRRPYTRAELRGYLAALRRRCHEALLALTDERARQSLWYSWSEGQAVSYLEVLLYSMRHVQEHAAQLSLVLGQHDIQLEDRDWFTRAGAAPGGE
jgi:hypothetical protein